MPKSSKIKRLVVSESREGGGGVFGTSDGAATWPERGGNCAFEKVDLFNLTRGS